MAIQRHRLVLTTARCGSKWQDLTDGIYFICKKRDTMFPPKTKVKRLCRDCNVILFIQRISTVMVNGKCDEWPC